MRFSLEELLAGIFKAVLYSTRCFGRGGAGVVK